MLAAAAVVVVVVVVDGNTRHRLLPVTSSATARTPIPALATLLLLSSQPRALTTTHDPALLAQNSLLFVHPSSNTSTHTHSPSVAHMQFLFLLLSPVAAAHLALKPSLLPSQSEAGAGKEARGFRGFLRQQPHTH